jgi:hypothetical protein
MSRKIGSTIRNTTIIIGITAVIFVVVNLWAAQAFRHRQFPPSDPMWKSVYTPTSREGAPIVRQVFSGESDQDISARAVGIEYRLHPGLAYAVPPINRPHYHIGLENVRYHDDWTDEEVKRRLASDKLTLILGGSTTFGAGVSNDETWPFYFDQAIRGRGEVSLNLGTISYDQQREIDRLIYHLRRGVRPRRVILLDGYNDLFLATDSNLRLGDRIGYDPFLATHGDLRLFGGLRLRERNWWRLLGQALPAVQWLQSKWQPELTAEQIIFPRDAFTQGYDFREAEWAHFFWYKWALPKRQQIEAQLIEQYRANLDFLDRLSKAFGFEALVFYQPIGLFDTKNLFVTEAAQQTSEYEFLASLDEAVRAQIGSGTLRMIDLHEVLGPLAKNRYVDATHYSPAAHQLFAHAIFGYAKPLSP